MMVRILVVVAVLGWLGLADSSPTCSQIDQMKTAITNLTKSIQTITPLMIRLGFHDCVGGCNGCINFNNPDNNGLSLAVDTLAKLYNDNGYSAYGVSRADFFALAATVAVTVGVQSSNKARNGPSCNPQSCPGPCPSPSFVLKFGRQDVSDCSTSEPALPSPKMTSTEMYDYFYKTFGFNKSQTVALLGAHSIGGARPDNSGYRGKWTGPNNPGFNELFYLNMINSTNSWVNSNVAPKNETAKWQYIGTLADNTTAGFMLNTDFELFYDLSLDSTTGQTTCKLEPTCGVTNTCSATACPKASTFDLAKSYSQNCTLFMNDFTAVFQAMLEYGGSNLVSVTCP